MSEFKGTPGPWSFIAREWQLGRKHSDWVVYDDGHNWICLGPSWDAEFARESEANARLIAAAPDLLNALTVLADAAEARGIPCDAARAAITRATGETE